MFRIWKSFYKVKMDFWEKRIVPLVYFIYLLNSYVRRKYTFTCIFLQSVNIFAILQHPCSFWVYPDLFDAFCYPSIRLFQYVTLCLKGQTFWSWKLNKIFERWSFQNNIRGRRGEDDGYANQPMCAIFSRSIGRSDVIIVQSHMCVNFPCMWVGRGVRENSTITFKIEVLDR